MGTKPNSNTGYIYACRVFLIFFSLASAALTADFMYSITIEMPQLITCTFILVGILLDGIKTFFPAMALRVKDKSFAAASVFMALVLLIMGLSFTASVHSIERSIEGALAATTASKVANERIDLLKAELLTEQQLHAKQLEVNHVSKADVTAQRISVINAEINSLLAAKHLNQDSFLATYRNLIAYALAAAIEVCCLALVAASHFLKESGTTPHLEAPEIHNEALVYACTTDEKTHANIVSLPHDDAETVVLDALRDALLEHKVQPNQRSIYASFSDLLTQRQIPMYLTKLADAGHLVALSHGRFRLA